MNSQTAIGEGVVDKASGEGNESEITGATTLLGNASGMAAGTNGLVSITYRGEENFWGNIWKFTDGMNIYCDIANSVHDLYVADNTFAESTQASPYANAGITLATRTDMFQLWLTVKMTGCLYLLKHLVTVHYLLVITSIRVQLHQVIRLLDWAVLDSGSMVGLSVGCEYAPSYRIGYRRSLGVCTCCVNVI